MGESQACTGNGAVMPVLARVPDAPTVQYVSRACSTLVVQCNSGLSNNGGEVFAYSVSYYRSDLQTVQAQTMTIYNPGYNYNTNQVNTWNNNVNNVMNDQQTWYNRQFALGDLQDGTEYVIYCQAQNRIGYSASSQSINLQAGIAAIQPYNVLTQLTGDHSSVAISWDYRNNQCYGWPVTQCTVSIQRDQQ
jgi:hypothetical protein